MRVLRAIAGWLAYRRLVRAPGPQPFDHRHDPDRRRALQRLAARQALAAPHKPARRAFAGQRYGDAL